MKKTKGLSICALFAALICAGAFIKLPTPLPITLQTLFTCLAGLVLGGKKGTIAVGVYIFMGLIGLPVFAEGGGLFYVLKPSFGYILGFIPATFITGRIAEKQTTFRRFILAAFAGMAVIYIIGPAYYFLISRYYLKNQLDVVWLIIYGFIMTLPGDILMCILSTSLGVKLKKIIKI